MSRSLQWIVYTRGRAAPDSFLHELVRLAHAIKNSLFLLDFRFFTSVSLPCVFVCSILTFLSLFLSLSLSVSLDLSIGAFPRFDELSGPARGTDSARR